MAFIKLEVRSKVLSQRTVLDIIMPFDEIPYIKNKMKPKLLFLLHGLTDDNSAWMNYTAIGRYAADNGIIVVMPSCPYSMYSDMIHGFKYYTFVTEELPEVIKTYFNIKMERENSFIAGLSMGGYGALKIGLSRPDLFSGIASFSAPVDAKSIVKELVGNYEHWTYNAFANSIGVGDDIAKENNLFLLIKENIANIPKILITCGIQDSLYDQNIHFKNELENLNIEHKFMEWKGDHTFSFWDRSIVEAIDFFMNNNYSNKIYSDWK